MTERQLKRIINEEIENILNEEQTDVSIETQFKASSDEVLKTLESMFDKIVPVKRYTGSNNDFLFTAWDIVGWTPYLNNSQLSKLKKLGWSGERSVDAGGEAGWYGGKETATYNIMAQYNYNKSTKKSYIIFSISIGPAGRGDKTFNNYIPFSMFHFFDKSDVENAVKKYTTYIKSQKLEPTIYIVLVKGISTKTIRSNSSYDPGGVGGASYSSYDYTNVRNIKGVDGIFKMSRNEFESLFRGKSWKIDMDNGLLYYSESGSFKFD